MITVKLAEEGDAVELTARENGDKGEKERLRKIAGRAFGMDFNAMTHDLALSERFDSALFDSEPIERYDPDRDFRYYDPGPLIIRVKASREDGKAAIRALAEELTS